MGQEYKQFRKPGKRGDGNYLVTDLYLAGFLIARGSAVIGVEATGQRGRLAFIVSPGASFAADCADFESNQPILIRDFLDAVYQAKQLMRSA